MRDITGYWDDSYTERKPQFDVTTSLRTEYVHIMSTEYETIQSLFGLSILQEYCAKNVVTRMLPLDIFLQATLQSVKGALRAAIKISGLFSQNAKQFNFVMSVVKETSTRPRPHYIGGCRYHRFGGILGCLWHFWTYRRHHQPRGKY